MTEAGPNSRVERSKMAKKSKMAPTGEVTQETQEVAAAAEPTNGTASKLASLTLKSSKSGASFTFNVRPESRMKGGLAGPKLTVDGSEIESKVSSNERLAAEGKTLWRFWLTLPNGMFGYVITACGESVEAFVETNGTEFVAESGRASRPDPKRELAKPIVRKPKAEAPVEGEAAPTEEVAAE